VPRIVRRAALITGHRRRPPSSRVATAGVNFPDLQMRELESAGVSTLAQLGTLPVPLPFVPGRGAAKTYLRVRDQARVQLEGRIRQAPVHELLPIEQDQGLSRLPAPSPGSFSIWKATRSPEMVAASIYLGF
jgi:hypothetical protein